MKGKDIDNLVDALKLVKLVPVDGNKNISRSSEQKTPANQKSENFSDLLKHKCEKLKEKRAAAQKSDDMEVDGAQSILKSSGKRAIEESEAPTGLSKKIPVPPPVPSKDPKKWALNRLGSDDMEVDEAPTRLSKKIPVPPPVPSKDPKKWALNRLGSDDMEVDEAPTGLSKKIPVPPPVPLKDPKKWVLKGSESGDMEVDEAHSNVVVPVPPPVLSKEKKEAKTDRSKLTMEIVSTLSHMMQNVLKSNTSTRMSKRKVEKRERDPELNELGPVKKRKKENNKLVNYIKADDDANLLRMLDSYKTGNNEGKQRTHTRIELQSALHFYNSQKGWFPSSSEQEMKNTKIRNAFAHAISQYRIVPK